MGRYKFIAYEKSSTPRYIVVYSLQWHIIDTHRIEPHADLFAVMTSAMEQFATEGWEAEGDALYGFVFIRRLGERRMLMLMQRAARAAPMTTTTANSHQSQADGRGSIYGIGTRPSRRLHHR